MDEKNQRISVSLHQRYKWKDDRIKINNSHTYWSNNVSHLGLNGEFVERCLWTPGMQFKDLIEIETTRTTALSSEGSPVKVRLFRSGEISVFLQNLQITVSCSMDFDGYPFDQQVKTHFYKYFLNHFTIECNSFL